MKMREDWVDIGRCSECGSENLISEEESGEIICGDCGLVINDYTINKGPEWRAFNPREEEDRRRVGAPISFSVHDKGLTTIISRVGRDALGRKLPQKTRLKMLKLSKWQRRSRVHSSIDRNLSQAMTELDRLTDKLHIPPTIQEEAAIIYRKALAKDLVRGRSIAAIVAAALYAACRVTRTPRTLKEVAAHSPIEKKDIARGYRLLLKELNLKMPIPHPEERIPKIAAKVGVGERTQQRAVEIIRRARELGATAGKDPSGLAAAALNIACILNDEKKTQKTIADAAGVTEVTIRNRNRGLKESLKLNI